MAFPTGWGRKCAVVIDKDQVGGTLSDFPVLLTEANLPSEMFDADGSHPALNGGGDIRFSSDSAGSAQLACEVVSFVTDNNPANGTAQIHVKVPSISATVDTTIYVWYEKSGESQPTASDTYGSQNAWDSDFVSSHHLEEDPEGGAGAMQDSTANNLDGSEVEVVDGNVSTAAGKVGKGISLSPGTTSYGAISLGDPAALRLTGAMTLEAIVKTTNSWVDPNSFGLVYAISKVGFSGNRGYGLGVFSDSANPIFHIASDSVTQVLVTGSSSLSNDTYYHLAGTYDPSTALKVYYNGTLDGTNSTSIPASQYSNNSKNVYFGGRYSDTGGFLKGNIDEVRISSTVRSAAWLLTTYNTLFAPATFAAAGTPLDGGGGGFQPAWAATQRSSILGGGLR